MSGFADSSEPTTFLTPPKQPEEFSQGLLLDTFNDCSDLMSPTYWVTEAYDMIFGFNPLDEVVEWFSGDWEALAKCAELWTNIGKACEAVSDNLKAGNTSLDATWNGNAADAAYVYFDELAKKLHGQKESFDTLCKQYQHLAHAAYSTAEAIKGYLSGIIDGLLITALELAGGTLLSWTGVGAAVGYGLAALEIANIMRLWAQATSALGNVQGIVNGAVGVVETVGATLYGTFQGFPIPNGESSYNHPNPAVI